MSTYYTGNYYLSEKEKQVNALFIRDYLFDRGWSINAICGMLGNFETESSINPGIWENLDVNNLSGGYGLVQWTPATKYLDWCALNQLDGSRLETALQRIEWELENGEQYYSTDAFPLSFSEFKTSSQSPTYLANAFLNNYERPLEAVQPARGEQAEKWFKYLTSVPVTPDKAKKMSLYMLFLASRGRVQ